MVECAESLRDSSCPIAFRREHLVYWREQFQNDCGRRHDDSCTGSDYCELRDDGSPQIESMSATPLKEATAEGNAVLFVQFAPDQKIGDQVNTVIDDREVIFRDDGIEGDENKGDGTYSAVIFLDFDELAKNQDEIQAVNAEPDPDDDEGAEGNRPQSSRRKNARIRT